jgi:copper homeostasis protein CutC
MPKLAALVRQSAGRVVILAGGSLDETTAPLVVAATGVAEVHLRATEPSPSRMTHRPPGITVSKPHTPDDYTRQVASAARVQRLNALLNAGS